jgi:transposase
MDAVVEDIAAVRGVVQQGLDEQGVAVYRRLTSSFKWRIALRELGRVRSSVLLRGRLETSAAWPGPRGRFPISRFEDAKVRTSTARNNATCDTDFEALPNVSRCLIARTPPVWCL